MCFAGATMIGNAFGAMGELANFGSQEEQYEAKEQQYAQNIEDAEADNRADETSLTLREMQENQSYSEQDHQALIEKAQKQAQVMAAAGSSGVAGNSVGQLVAGIGVDINEKRATLETNWANTATQLQSQKDTAVAQEMARINQVAAPYSPNPMGALAGAAGDLFGAHRSDTTNFFGTPSPSTGLVDPSIAANANLNSAPVDLPSNLAIM